MTTAPNETANTSNRPPQRQAQLIACMGLGAILVLSACGSDDSTTAGPTTSASISSTDNDEPTSTAATTPTVRTTAATPTTATAAPDTSTGDTIGGAILSVAEATAIDDDDVHDVEGFVVGDGVGLWLCTALAESHPPQCGQPSLALAGIATARPETLLPDQLTTDAQALWTERTVVLSGVIIGDELWIAE